MSDPFPEYDEFDAVGLAELVRNGEVSAAELVDAAIARIEARNAALNAVVTKLYDRAREQAQGPLPDGPFRGVPFLLKDLFIDLAGAPTSNGSGFFDGYVPDYDTEVVRRLIAAGFVIVGKTNTPELGLAVTTESKRLGPARNPYDTTRTTGGSSGGSAAAVAARMVPAAGASDGGGSIRIPASRCGLVGLKPSRGRTPMGPKLGEPFGGQSVEHALTRSVRDSAALLDVMAGHDAGAPYTAPTPDRAFSDEVGRDPGRLRIAYFAEPLLPGGIHSEVQAALEETVQTLCEVGHDLLEARPRVDGPGIVNALFEVTAGTTAASMLDFERMTGRRPRARDFEIETWTLVKLGRSLSASQLAASWERLRVLGREMAHFMLDQGVDLLLCPTMPDPPFELGSSRTPAFIRLGSKLMPGGLGIPRLLHGTAFSRQAVCETFSVFPYTPVFNATGQPSMNLPLAWSKDGLPLGMLFTAAYGDEACLIRLATQLEAARPWRDRRPPPSTA